MNHEQVFKFRSFMESLSKDEVMRITEKDLFDKLGFEISERSIYYYRKEKGWNKRQKDVEDVEIKDFQHIKDALARIEEKIDKIGIAVSLK